MVMLEISVCWVKLSVIFCTRIRHVNRLLKNFTIVLIGITQFLSLVSLVVKEGVKPHGPHSSIKIQWNPSVLWTSTVNVEAITTIGDTVVRFLAVTSLASER